MGDYNLKHSDTTNNKLLELPHDFFNHNAQDGGFYPDSHVDFGIIIENFGKRQNLIIEGIRGTGKTHILKMIEKYHLNNFQTTRILPIYVSLADTDSDQYIEDLNKFSVHLYFNIFLKCIETLRQNSQNLQSKKKVHQEASERIVSIFVTLLGGVRPKRLPFPKILEKVEKLLKTMLDELKYDLTAKTVKTSNNKTTSKKRNLGLSGTLGNDNLGINTHLDSESIGMDSEAHELEESYINNPMFTKSASVFLIDLLRQIQIMLDLEYTIILLDECSQTSREGLVEIFRLFKKMKGARSLYKDNKDCVFFIGAVYPQTYYPNQDKDLFSFAPPHDFKLEFLQWDETDIEGYARFFEYILLFRAKDRVGYKGLNPRDLIKILFDSYETFLLATFCSHGIPRRFLEILNLAYDAVTRKITFASVTTSVHRIVNQYILGSSRLTEDDKYFAEQLVKRITLTNTEFRKLNNRNRNNSVPQTIYFAIPKSRKSILDRLILEGVVHEKARMRTSGKTINSFSHVYALDMAVAFAHNVIPPSMYVEVLNQDIPRCEKNGFAQCLDLHEEALQEIIDKSNRIENLEEGVGIIKELSERQSFIWSEDRNEEIFFFENQLETKEGSVKPRIGDKVRFRIRKTYAGLQALELKIIAYGIPIQERGQKVYGFVARLNVQKKLGFIKVLDEGGEVFFRFTNLLRPNEELKEGDYVEFNLHKSTYTNRFGDKQLGRTATKVEKRQSE
jgi:cold shock CspA family protein